MSLVDHNFELSVVVYNTCINLILQFYHNINHYSKTAHAHLTENARDDEGWGSLNKKKGRIDAKWLMILRSWWSRSRD